VRNGFTPREARDAYGLVSACAVGAAFAHIREEEAERSGRPLVAENHRAHATRGGDQLPHLRALVESAGEAPALEDQIRTVLAGIAVQRGEAWPRIFATTDEDDDARVIPLHP
jgi:hypothetical protein